MAMAGKATMPLTVIVIPLEKLDPGVWTKEKREHPCKLRQQYGFSHNSYKMHIK